MAKTPYTRLTTPQLQALLSSTLGNLYPYQIRQIQDALDKMNFKRSSNSDVSVEPNMTTVVGLLGTNNP